MRSFLSVYYSIVMMLSLLLVSLLLSSCSIFSGLLNRDDDEYQKQKEYLEYLESLELKQHQPPKIVFDFNESNMTFPKDMSKKDKDLILSVLNNGLQWEEESELNPVGGKQYSISWDEFRVMYSFDEEKSMILQGNSGERQIAINEEAMYIVNKALEDYKAGVILGIELKEEGWSLSSNN